MPDRRKFPGTYRTPLDEQLDAIQDDLPPGLDVETSDEWPARAFRAARTARREHYEALIVIRDLELMEANLSRSTELVRRAIHYVRDAHMRGGEGVWLQSGRLFHEMYAFLRGEESCSCITCTGRMSPPDATDKDPAHD